MLVPLAGDRATDIVRAYAACQRLVEGEGEYRSHRDVLTATLVRAAATRGVRLSHADASVLPRSWSSMRLFDDVETMLAELRRSGCRLAVLTNTDDDLFEITHRTFRRPFDLFVTAERVRGYKPTPWQFRAFERLTGVARRDWVHVGSSWYHDIEPAKALGVKRVWLEREPEGEGHSAQSVVSVRSGLEAVKAIQGQLAA